LKELPVEDNSCKDKSILCPLADAHGFYKAAYHNPILHDTCLRGWVNRD
jgi:hypothetical protein